MKCDPSTLFGMWLIDESRFRAMVATAKDADRKPPTAQQAPGYRTGGRRGSLAFIEVSGPLTKYPTSFSELLGGTAMLETKNALRRAREDASVKGIVMVYDSPGGTVAGSSELVSEIRKTDKVKPVYSVIDDNAMSAAYKLASQGRRVFANPSSLVGSIGTVMELYDESKKLAGEGIKVHVVASSNFKATGYGDNFSKEQIADVQRVVDDLRNVFAATVAAGRGLTAEQVDALADGRIHVGAKAKEIGLVDEIVSFDEAIEIIDREVFAMSDPIGAFASAHPDAVEKWRAEGVASALAGNSKAVEQAKAEGIASERTRFGVLQTAFASRPAFVCEQFGKGANVGEAKGALADVLETELKAEREKSKELAEQAASGHTGVTLPRKGAPAASFERHKLKPEDVDVTVAEHWSADAAGEKTLASEFKTKEGYRRYLASEANANVVAGRV